MRRWAAPEANSTGMRSMKVFRTRRWAAPEANSTAARRAEVHQ